MVMNVLGVLQEVLLLRREISLSIDYCSVDRFMPGGKQSESISLSMDSCSNCKICPILQLLNTMSYHASRIEQLLQDSE